MNAQEPTTQGQSAFLTKGMLYRGMLSYLTARTPLDALLAPVGDERLRTFLSQPFLAATWYDVLPFAQLVELGARATGVTFADLAISQAREQAAHDLGGVYRAILRVTPADTVAEFLPKIAARYFNFGSVASAKVGPRHMRTTRLGIPEPFARYHGLAAAVYATVALERAGAKGVRATSASLEPDGRLRGVELRKIVYEVRWEE